MGNTDSKKDKCCPIVVDPLTFTALLGAIAAATAFLNTLITMNITKRRRKRAAVGALEEATGITDHSKRKWWGDSIAYVSAG